MQRDSFCDLHLLIKSTGPFLSLFLKEQPKKKDLDKNASAAAFHIQARKKLTSITSKNQAQGKVC